MKNSLILLLDALIAYEKFFLDIDKLIINLYQKGSTSFIDKDNLLIRYEDIKEDLQNTLRRLRYYEKKNI